MPRPDESGYRAAIASIARELDMHAESTPNPGRIATFRRLTKTEYRNAIRDLLAVEVNVDSLLPNDEASHGFDNVTVGDLPPMLLERYVSAARENQPAGRRKGGEVPGRTTPCACRPSSPRRDIFTGFRSVRAAERFCRTRSRLTVSTRFR